MNKFAFAVSLFLGFSSFKAIAGEELYIPTANEFKPIYAEMVNIGFKNGTGHTVAAAKLTACLPGLKAGAKVESLESILKELGRSRITVVKNRFTNGIQCDPEVTMLAATLACKRGDRTAKELVTKLTDVYLDLVEKHKYLNVFWNVQVSAELML